MTARNITKQEIELIKISKKEHERRMVFARQEVAKAWCKKTTKGLDRIPELEEEFAKILVKHMYEVHLGCATTIELLAEISARIDLDYKTLGGDF